jgi:hypothetical protein
MTKSSLIRALLISGVLCVAATVSAEEIGKDLKIGVGVDGGTVANGLSVKYYLAEATAAQVVVGVQEFGTSIDAHYIMEFPALYESDAGRFFWGAGGGAGVYMYSFDSGLPGVEEVSEMVLSVQGVVELGWHFKSMPLEIISDWRPTFNIGDAVSGFAAGGGGGAIRWFF